LSVPFSQERLGSVTKTSFRTNWEKKQLRKTEVIRQYPKVTPKGAILDPLGSRFGYFASLTHAGMTLSREPDRLFHLRAKSYFSFTHYVTFYGRSVMVSCHYLQDFEFFVPDTINRCATVEIFIMLKNPFLNFNEVLSVNLVGILYCRFAFLCAKGLRCGVTHAHLEAMYCTRNPLGYWDLGQGAGVRRTCDTYQYIPNKNPNLRLRTRAISAREWMNLPGITFLRDAVPRGAEMHSQWFNVPVCMLFGTVPRSSAWMTEWPMTDRDSVSRESYRTKSVIAIRVNSTTYFSTSTCSTACQVVNKMSPRDVFLVRHYISHVCCFATPLLIY
jgi:hypothetical protein